MNTSCLKRSTLAAVMIAASSAWLCRASGAAQPTPSDWDDRIKLGVHAYNTGENRVAFETFSKLMTEGGTKFGASDGRMARIYVNMGEVYDAEHQYAYAEECLKRGLNVARAGYGEQSPQTLPALVDLAQTYVHEGKAAQAQPLLKQALAIAERPAGDAQLQPFVAVIEANLGSMYFAGGNLEAAEPHFKHAAQVAAECFGASHQWATTISAMYAACLRALGKSAEAKAVQQAALAKANENESAIAVWNVEIGKADAALSQEKYSDAEAALKQALQASQQLAAEPMLRALALARYGKLLLLQNKPPLAIEQLKAAQAIADSVLGLEDPSVLARAKQLAELEKSQDQFPDAEPLYSRLAAHAKKQYGESSQEYASALADLGGLYNSWAQYPKAAATYSKLLAWQEKQFGAASEKLIPTLVALATATGNNTKYLAEVNEQAEGYLKRAADIAAQHFGKGSKEQAAILDDFSYYYQKRLSWDKAIQMCAKVVAADEKNFGPSSSETAKALEHYAVVLRAAGLRDQAEPVEARIEKIKGTGSPANP
jgi:tetratricopeptide (TPR) repeat protein